MADLLRPMETPIPWQQRLTQNQRLLQLTAQNTTEKL
jgi:hypothetical protein